MSLLAVGAPEVYGRTASHYTAAKYSAKATGFWGFGVQGFRASGIRALGCVLEPWALDPKPNSETKTCSSEGHP